MPKLLTALTGTITLLATPVTAFAQAYGEGAFGTSIYNGAANTSTPSNTITTPLGNLPVTGQTIAIAGFIGLILIAAGLVIFARRRHSASA